MYRCQVCGNTVKKGTPMRRFATYREKKYQSVKKGYDARGKWFSEQVQSTGREIEREISVCELCHAHLELGTPISVIRDLIAREKENRREKAKRILTSLGDTH